MYRVAGIHSNHIERQISIRIAAFIRTHHRGRITMNKWPIHLHRIKLYSELGIASFRFDNALHPLEEPKCTPYLGHWVEEKRFVAKFRIENSFVWVIHTQKNAFVKGDFFFENIHLVFYTKSTFNQNSFETI